MDDNFIKGPVDSEIFVSGRIHENFKTALKHHKTNFLRRLKAEIYQSNNQLKRFITQLIQSIVCFKLFPLIFMSGSG